MADEKDKPKTEEQTGAPRATGAEAPAQAPATGEAKAAEGAAAEPARAPRSSKSRSTRHVPFGIAYVTATFNNTIVTVTDPKGAVIAWSSAGRAGFKGSRKSTAFAATVVGQETARQVVSKGMREVEVRVQGPGAGRESAIRAMQSAGLSITVIKDTTPMPHNGCRPRKRRRV